MKKFIQELELSELSYEELIPKTESDKHYGRHILCLHPFECVLLNWPTGVESGIHDHQGMYGYVWMLEGELDNVFYKEEEGKLIQQSIQSFGRGKLIPEPDGVIHKLKNNSTTKRAISLHFYYPALENLDGMRLFNVETGDIGILSDQAQTACWDEQAGHFKEVHRGAFEYVPLVVQD